MAPPLKQVLLVGVLLLLSLIVIYASYDPPLPAPFHRLHDEVLGHKSGSEELSLQKVLQFIYNPTGFQVTTPSFTDPESGNVYELPAELLYENPLGKDVCILDVDTRAFEDDNQIFHENDFNFTGLQPHSGGILNHYTYAHTHGYDYKFVRAPAIPGRHNTWVKIPGLLSVLAQYKFVIFMDADALFNQMHIPIEWLLNYWSITPTTSLAMAADPDAARNYDSKGRVYLNTGFIIAQNSEKTHEMLRALDECPEEKRYEGCKKWADTRFDEQAAFGEYVRYDYEEYVKELPCAEANGEWDLAKCKGVFIHHMWWRTRDVANKFGEKTTQSLMSRLHEHVIEERTHIVQQSHGGGAYGEE